MGVDKAVGNRPLAGSKSTPLIIGAALATYLIIAGVLATAPFFFAHPETSASGERHWRIINTHDMPNHFRYMESFDQSLRSGELEPRWFPEVNKSYGSPTFDFYPRIFYYATSFINLFFNDWLYTMFIVSALGLAASGLAFYKLARAFYGRAASLVGALIYMLLPIRLLDLYWRGAMTQYFSLIFVPLAIYFAYRVGTAGRATSMAGLAFFYGLLILTQFPVGYMFTYALTFYAVAWGLKQRDWKIAFRIGCGIALGLVLGATYWFPAAYYSNAVMEVFSKIFDYHKSYLLPSATPPPFDAALIRAFYFSLILMLAAYYILRATRRFDSSDDKTHDPRIGASRLPAESTQLSLWLVMSAATIFMTTPYSYYISVLIPKIQITFPPFRWLAITAAFVSLLATACIARLWDSRNLPARAKWAYRAIIVAAVAVNIAASVYDNIIATLRNPLYVPPQEFSEVIDEQFIPANAAHPTAMPDTPKVALEPGGEAEITRWDPERREVALRLDQPATVRLRTYNFPGWVARIDGQRAPLASDGDGAQVVSVPAGIHKLEVTYENTPPRLLANLLSAAALLLIIGLVVYGKKRKRA